MFFRNDSLSFPEGQFQLQFSPDFVTRRPARERGLLQRLEGRYDHLTILEVMMAAAPISDYLHLIGSPENGYVLARQDQNNGYYYPQILGTIEFIR